MLDSETTAEDIGGPLPLLDLLSVRTRETLQTHEVRNFPAAPCPSTLFGKNLAHAAEGPGNSRRTNPRCR